MDNRDIVGEGAFGGVSLVVFLVLSVAELAQEAGESPSAEYGSAQVAGAVPKGIRRCGPHSLSALAGVVYNNRLSFLRLQS